MKKDFVTIHEASKYLGKSAQTIRRMIKRGDLSAKRIRTPQGFHYVLSRDDIGMNGIIEKVSKTNSKKEMLSKTIVEKPIEAEVEAKKTLSPYQGEIPTNQTAQQPHEQALNRTIDKNDLAEALKRNHKENLRYFAIIERLQFELDLERRRPKSFFAYFCDWLSH